MIADGRAESSRCLPDLPDTLAQRAASDPARAVSTVSDDETVLFGQRTLPERLPRYALFLRVGRKTLLLGRVMKLPLN